MPPPHLGPIPCGTWEATQTLQCHRAPIRTWYPLIAHGYLPTGSYLPDLDEADDAAFALALNTEMGAFTT
jgi:hypothetical protein